MIAEFAWQSEEEDAFQSAFLLDAARLPFADGFVRSLKANIEAQLCYSLSSTMPKTEDGLVKLRSDVDSPSLSLRIAGIFPIFLHALSLLDQYVHRT